MRSARPAAPATVAAAELDGLERSRADPTVERHCRRPRALPRLSREALRGAVARQRPAPGRRRFRRADAPALRRPRTASRAPSRSGQPEASGARAGWRRRRIAPTGKRRGRCGRPLRAQLAFGLVAPSPSPPEPQTCLRARCLAPGAAVRPDSPATRAQRTETYHARIAARRRPRRPARILGGLHRPRAQPHVEEVPRAWMRDAYRRAQEGLPPARSRRLLVPGSGTFGMEAARQVGTGKPVLVIRQRLVQLPLDQIFDDGKIPSHSVHGAEGASGRSPAASSPGRRRPSDRGRHRSAREAGGGVRALHVETAAGMILPDDYLKAVADVVHGRGGLFVLDCIARAIWVDMEGPASTC